MACDYGRFRQLAGDLRLLFDRLLAIDCLDFERFSCVLWLLHVDRLLANAVRIIQHKCRRVYIGAMEPAHFQVINVYCAVAVIT